jgi:glycosyltransferase involved in cell wall biosynthesis
MHHDLRTVIDVVTSGAKYKASGNEGAPFILYEQYHGVYAPYNPFAKIPPELKNDFGGQQKFAAESSAAICGSSGLNVISFTSGWQQQNIVVVKTDENQSIKNKIRVDPKHDNSQRLRDFFSEQAPAIYYVYLPNGRPIVKEDLWPIMPGNIAQTQKFIQESGLDTRIILAMTGNPHDAAFTHALRYEMGLDWPIIDYTHSNSFGTMGKEVQQIFKTHESRLGLDGKHYQHAAPEPRQHAQDSESQVVSIESRYHLTWRKLIEEATRRLSDVVAVTAPSHSDPERGMNFLDSQRVVVSIPGVNRNTIGTMRDMLSLSFMDKPLDGGLLQGTNIHRTIALNILRPYFGDLSGFECILFAPVRIDPAKGIQHTLGAARIAKEKHNIGNICVLILGDANENNRSYRDYILATASKDNIELRIHPPVSEIHKIYAALSELPAVLVLLSEYEPFGMVPVEACAARIPNIVSEVCGCAEVFFAHEENGIIINHNEGVIDCDQAAYYISKLTYDGEFRARILDEGYRSAETATWTGNVITALRMLRDTLDLAPITGETHAFEHAILRKLLQKPHESDSGLLRAFGVVRYVNQYPECIDDLTVDDIYFVIKHQEDIARSGRYPEALSLLEQKAQEVSHRLDSVSDSHDSRVVDFKSTQQDTLLGTASAAQYAIGR